MELLDFHTHLDSPHAIVCTDSPDLVGHGMFDCVGLLPANLSPQAESSFFSLLSSNPALRIGEVGLDRRFADSVPLEVQEAFLRKCLSLGRTVSVHCVRETQRMVTLLKEAKGCVVWHGFNGSVETARALDRMGIWISVGPRCTAPAGYGLPFLIETDYTGNDGAEYARMLEKQYHDCAALCGASVEQLKEAMHGRSQAIKDNRPSR